MISLNSLLCFIIPFTLPIRINLLYGEFRIGEIFLPILFLVNIKSIIRSRKIPTIRKVYILYVLYFISLIVSDIYRNSEPRDFLRGWSKLIITGLSLSSFIGAFWEKKKNILLFITGITSSIIFKIFTEPDSYPITINSYKFVYGSHICLIFLLFDIYYFNFKSSHKIISLFLLVVLSTLLNFRSLAGQQLLTSTLFTFSLFIPNKILKHPYILGLFMLFSISILSLSIFETYKWAAPLGLIGQAAKSKFDMQQERSGGSFSLISGREELIFALPKILESPFIGWGSWAKDKDYVYDRFIEYFGEDKHFSGIAADQGVIPTHSHLIAGWLEAGILGLLFWAFIAFILIKNLLLINRYFWPKENLLVIFLIVTSLWDLFFSPYAGPNRCTSGALIAYMIYISYSIKESNLRAFKFKNNSKESLIT